MKKQTFDEWIIEQDGKEIKKWRNAYFELQQRINKTINYIERCRDYHNTYHKDGYLYPDEITNLLMILEGNINEE